MQKIILPIFLFFLISTVSQSQNNFIKGTIFTTEKDTIRGYIDYKEWIKSPLEILFKREINEAGSTYSTTDLNGFSIDYNQENYEVLNFSIEKFLRNGIKPIFSNLSSYANRKKVIMEKKAFVRVLAKGKVNLYYFVDKDLDEHFLVKYNGIIEPLIYHIIDVGDKTAQLKQYQVQLANILAEACKKLPIQSTDYLVDKMAKLINSYNACFETTIKPEPIRKPKGRLEYGISAGMDYSRFKHIFPILYFRYVTLIGSNNYNPVGGIFFNYVFARGRERFTLLTEINTYSFKSTTNYDDNYYHYDIRYMALQNLFRYTVHVGKPSVYFVGGLKFGFTMKNKSIIESADGTTKPDNGNGVSEKFRSDEQAIVGGIGSSFGRFMIECRYIRGNGFSASPNSDTSVQRFEILSKINFGRIH